MVTGHRYGAPIALLSVVMFVITFLIGVSFGSAAYLMH
jgi:hypothetical protein